MTKLFNLSEQEANLNNVHHRVEKFGEGSKLACDLEFSFDSSNDFLSEFHPTLKWSLYDRPQTPDLADTDSHMPVLRYPKVGRLTWDQDWVNCKLTIHRLKDNIVLAECKVNKVRITPKDGGSVEIQFRAQFYPDPAKPAIMGKIDAMLEQGICTISLERPLDDEAEESAPQQSPVQTNTPEPNPVERAANDDDEDDGIRPGSAAAPAGRGGRRRNIAAVE